MAGPSGWQFIALYVALCFTGKGIRYFVILSHTENMLLRGLQQSLPIWTLM